MSNQVCRQDSKLEAVNLPSTAGSPDESCAAKSMQKFLTGIRNEASDIETQLEMIVEGAGGQETQNGREASELLLLFTKARMGLDLYMQEKVTA
jgi:hypothetical protein